MMAGGGNQQHHRHRRHRPHCRNWRGQPTRWHRQRRQLRRWIRLKENPYATPHGPDILNGGNLNSSHDVGSAGAPRNSVFTSARITSLKHLIVRYSEEASRAYQDNPEAFSHMILNMMELWVECDKYTTTFYPLLRDYATGIPAYILHSLVLPKREQLLRLASIEEYLQHRDEGASSLRTPPWEWRTGSPLTKGSFALRFYEQSATLKSFHDRIKAQTLVAKRKKLLELEKKQKQYEQLRRSLENTMQRRHRGCGNVLDWQGRDRLWLGDCRRCRSEEEIEKQIGRLRIQALHLPLPEDDSTAKAMVFEILVPDIIRSWRDATLHVLFALAGSEGSHTRFRNGLATAKFRYPESHFIIDDILQDPIFACSPNGRFRLASSFVFEENDADLVGIENAHEATIIKQQYYHYDMYDTKFKRSVSEIPKLLLQASSSPSYHYLPPAGADSSLKPWICQTSHSLNDVMARLSERPRNMGLEEFKAFGNMRAGVDLQWLNVLIQLAIPVLDFNKIETLYLLLQATNQAGRRHDASRLRVAHSWLADEAFGLALVGSLGRAVARIQDNRECYIAWCIFLLLLLRLLSLTPSPLVAERCLSCLGVIRNKTIRFARELRQKLETINGDTEQREFGRQTLIMALLCHSTFDLGSDRLRSMVLGENTSKWPSPAHLMLEASMMVAENIAAENCYLVDRLLGLLLHRWRSLSFEAEPLLREAIARHPPHCNHLDTAIREIWSGCGSRQTSWHSPSRQHVHVMACDSVVFSGERPCRFQYNLLTGLLLVNGQPLSAMPQSIRSHPLYERLFGDIGLRVVPSTLPGMKFQTNHLGHQVHLATNGDEWIVRSLKDGRDCELIPESMLVGLFPDALVSGYTHWLVHAGDERLVMAGAPDRDYGMIEFRPAKDTWRDASGSSRDRNMLRLYLNKHWKGHLQIQARGKSSGELVHIGIRSDTAAAISQIFRPIEIPTHIQLAWEPQISKLSIHLPRYQLKFSLRQGEATIESDQYAGFMVDEDQSLGTLHGVRSKLVLRMKESLGGTPARRSVLVPEGEPTFVAEVAGYTSVYLVPSPAQPLVKHHMYRLKELPGVLKGSASLRSELHLCFLQAATSHFLPESLSGHTGTEQALRILRSGLVRSLVTNSSSAGTGSDLGMLHRIGSLSPLRTHAPVMARKVQTVKWRQISALAQSDELHMTVQELIDECRDSEMCFPHERGELKGQATPNLLLAKRSFIRQAFLRPPGADREMSPDSHDRIYGGRDDSNSRHSAELARRLVAVLSDHRQDRLTERILPASILKLATVLGCRIPESPSWLPGEYREVDVPGLSGELPLGFDLRWLGPLAVTLRRSWGRVYEWLTQNNMTEDSCNDKYDIMMYFAALSFAKEADSQIMQILLCFALSPAARPQRLMHSDITEAPAPLDLKHGTVLTPFDLECMAAFKICSSRGDLSSYLDDDDPRSELHGIIGQLVEELEQQGLCDNPVVADISMYDDWLDMDELMPEIRARFRSWLCNKQHMDYIRGVIEASQSFEILVDSSASDGLATPTLLVERYATHQAFRKLSLSFLMEHLAPHQIPTVTAAAFPDHLAPKESYKIQPQTEQLLGALDNLVDQDLAHPHRKSYVGELRSSLKSLLDSTDRSPASLKAGVGKEQLGGELDAHLQQCQIAVAHTGAAILASLVHIPHTKGRRRRGVTHYAPLWWPRITPVSLLEKLQCRSRFERLPYNWRRALVEYARSIALLHRAQRLALLFASAKFKLLAREMENTGHQGWDHLEHPEYLLFEVENELLIRPTQYRIASAMRRGDDDSATVRNAVMQLNMGEGKSSVIVPIVAAALADGTQIVRVIVTRPQFQQMMHTLCTKLGGLLGRQVYTLPFSRQLKPDAGQLAKMAAKTRQCMAGRGILLVQLDHILSMELWGIECLLSGNTRRETLGRTVLQAKAEVEKSAWDIVDESDEVFDAGFELTYSIGPQVDIDFSPQRWQIIQVVLGAVQAAIQGLGRGDSKSEGNDANFHSVLLKFRMLDSTSISMLLDTVARNICLGGRHEAFASIPLCSADHQEAFLRFVTQQQPMAQDISVMEARVPVKHDQRPLLLLRGLFAGGVLGFCLGQRWRVNFGLFYNRSPPTGLAVPYRAKDLPAPRAEFTHPDVVIVLSCISYYCEGLSNSALHSVFSHLRAEDRGNMVYEKWVAQADGENWEGQALPLTLQAVNLQDRGSCEKDIFGPLRHNKDVADYYLSNILFPREIKEFAKKLSASGWNLTGDRGRPLRGFSGTRDTNSLLPCAIQFWDLEEQRHTNASVLDCVMRDENCIHVLPSDANSTADSLLRSVVNNNSRDDMPIHVILDVGAQFLEDNVTIARKWLAMVPRDRANAVITFDDTHNLVVVAREGDPELFRLSMYSENTEGCLVFFDEAHTRGTDLALPDYYRAAVMLGPRLVKDKLMQGESHLYLTVVIVSFHYFILFIFPSHFSVPLHRQANRCLLKIRIIACMRMRKLGNGQSLCFFIPDEVKRAIQGVPGFQTDAPITKLHLITWSTWETFLRLERLGYQWAKHGGRHCRQQEALRRAKAMSADSGGVPGSMTIQPEVATVYLEDEARSLRERYYPARVPTPGGDTPESVPPLTGLWTAVSPEARLIRRRCEDLGVIAGTSGAGALLPLREEQEREISTEQEQEEEQQRVVEALHVLVAHQPVIHRDVESFVRTGEIPVGSDAFQPAFEAAFRNTSIASLVELEQFPDGLLVTAEFVRAVKGGLGFVSDKYQRPVQWIVTRSVDPSAGQQVERLVIFSPWEVDSLLYLIREQGAVTLHLYAPRTRLSSQVVDDLTLFTVPPLPPGWVAPRPLVQLLNIFAGQLFFTTHDESVELSRFLHQQRENWRMEEPGLGHSGTGSSSGNSPFTKCPKAFLRQLMSNIRGEARDIRETDMGRVLAGLSLDEEVFDRRQWKGVADSDTERTTTTARDAASWLHMFKITRIPRDFYQIFQRRYPSLPRFDKEQSSGSRIRGGENKSTSYGDGLAGLPIVGEVKTYNLHSRRDIESDRLFPTDLKNIHSFVLDEYSCFVCGQHHHRPSKPTTTRNAWWPLDTAQLRQSATGCSSCSLLLQAAQFMDPDRIKMGARSTAGDSKQPPAAAVLEVYYELGDMDYPVHRTFLKWKSEQEESTGDAGTFEVYWESKSFSSSSTTSRRFAN
ncbi:hypothetical protein V8F06_013081 [Rhypophila decipiens]